MKRLLSIAILALAVYAPSASAQRDRSARKYLKQGIEHFSKGDLAGAIADYDRALNADPKFDPFVLWHIGILFGHAALDFVGTSHGVDHAGELNESAVPGILDDASAMISDFGIEKRLSESFQLRQRAFFVDPYQAARARDIRRQNSRQSPLYVLAAQDAPPKAWGN